jgi:hypothetical protein
MLDGANMGRVFATAVEEKRPAVKLTAPTTNRRRHAKKTTQRRSFPARGDTRVAAAEARAINMR